jgi:P-type conjugative transfer protein TrbJ
MRSVPSRHRIRRMAAAGAIAVAVASSSAPASAFIVFDPRNYAENLLSASRALEQIQNQITSLQNEAQMLINQAKNLTSLPTSLLGQIEGNFSEMKSLLGEADKVAYSVQDIESQFTSTYENFGSDLSSQQLVDGARERWRTSISAFKHSLKAGAVAVDNIEGTQEQTSALVGASQSAVGVLQATQAGNQLLAVQAKQVADLTAMLAAQGRAAALEEARQAAAQERAREQFSRFMAGNGYSPSSVKMFHD